MYFVRSGEIYLPHGSLWRAGREAFSWSITAESTIIRHAFYSNFGLINIYPSNNGNHYNGFSLRCLARNLAHNLAFYEPLCNNYLMNSIWNTLPHGFTALAPMEGVTDVIFRQVIAKAGRPDLFFTEFTNVSSFASERGRENALERLKITPTDPPIIAQIWGKNPDHFAELAGALEELGFAGLDINMGCPDRHVNAAGGGAAMIRTPDLALECLEKARSSTNLPVSVKTRLGYTSVDEYRTWIPFLLEAHPAALTIHLRTRKEMSKVPAHFELIPSLVAYRDKFSPETKLIINGDIKNLTEVKSLSKQHPKVDGFMIGRGVFENPFCFTDHTPTQPELLDLFHLHLDLFDTADTELKIARSRLLGEGIDASLRGLPFDPLKHYFKIYINTFPGASDLRARLMECKNTSEVRQILADFTSHEI